MICGDRQHRIPATSNASAHPGVNPPKKPKKEILAKLQPEPEREPLPPRRYYEPPSKGRYKRR
jgi:hypothetical protein